MKLETYKTVTLKDRLMQAIEQIRKVDKKIGKKLPNSSYSVELESKFLRQCLGELRDCQDTLLTLHKEILFYVSG